MVKAIFDDIKASVEDNVHSTTNTTVKTKTIIDEVVLARGTTGSLDNRISSVIDSSGTFVAPANVLVTADAGALVGRNLLSNDDFLLWHAGAAAAPTCWALAGTGAAIARTGTGESDTQNLHYGDKAARVTFGTSTATLRQLIVDSGVFSRFTGFKARKICFGAKVKTTTASIARLAINDGASSSVSTYHTGSTTSGTLADGVEWLTAEHTISTSATQLYVEFQVTGAGVAYFGPCTAWFSLDPPGDWVPQEKSYGVFNHFIAGAVTTGTVKTAFPVFKPMLVKSVQLLAHTAPAGSNLIVDVNSNTNTTGLPLYASMFTAGGRPQIVDGTAYGEAAPDSATYETYSLTPVYSGSPVPARSLISLDVDQIGSGTAGSDLAVQIRYVQYNNPLDSWRARDDIGV